MNLTYIPADASDIEPIFTLSRDLILRYEDLTAIDCDRVLAWVHRKIEENITQYRRILAGGTHAGYFRLSPAASGWELDDLYILPALQGRGIGTAVIEDCCARGPVILYVFTNNTGALNLYRRLGFRVREQVSPTRLILERN